MTIRSEKAITTGNIPREWEREADVVIVGYGGAGAVAAISAHDAGADVLIVESMGQGGGNTAVSMGGFLCPSNVQEAITYITGLYQFSHSEMDTEMVRVFAEESVKNVEWIKGLKKSTEVQIYGHASFPQIPGADSMKKYLVKGNNKGMTAFAKNLWELLSHAVEGVRKIPVLTYTPAKGLVTSATGEVIGLVVGQDSNEVTILASRGVILTTGGYEFDTKTLQNHVKGFPIYSAGNPGNTGDGIRMALKAGAGLWHMNGVSCALGIKVPDFEAGFLASIGAPGHILVDRNGKRFVNERTIGSHSGLLAVDYYDSHALEYPRIPCYAIFDETTRLSGPISGMTGLGSAGQDYDWSKDNSAEIEKGWIIKGNSINELARQLEMDPAIMEETISRWNKDIKDGGDTLFGRTVKAEVTDRPEYIGLEPPVLSAPIETAPYYALPLYPCLINTQGGPRRNAAAQVLDAFGDPIPRLYSAGELGSMWGLIYQGAGNISECLVFGRLAGQNAAAEMPWEKEDF